MGLWLSRPREPDYDTYLSKLQEQISARQAKLQQIRLRERRANALLLTWAVGLWVLYTVLWYLGVVRIRLNGGPLDAVVSAAPVFVGPVLIVFSRRFLRWFYHRKQDKEETQLKTLVKQKQEKVEEIKKKTGYYSTRDLLEKYDEALKKSAGPGSAPGTPAKQPAPKPGQKPSILFPSAPGTPARPASALGFTTPQQQQLQPRGPGPQINQPPTAFPAPPGPLPPPQQSPGTPHRTFMDKFADALLGVSPEELSPNKYALICGKCFAHNGLVPPEQFDFVQYQCPRCGYFNPRRRDPPSSSQQQQFHRRVVSEMAPSPLSYSHPSSSSSASLHLLSTGDPSHSSSRIDDEREEEDREVAETLLSEQDIGEGARRGRGKGGEEETRTSAVKGGPVAQRRRGRKNVASDDEEEGGEDKMDTD